MLTETADAGIKVTVALADLDGSATDVAVMVSICCVVTFVGAV
jgi:hypothetical protein